MASNDLVILIPGITGSTLTRGGSDIWASKPSTVLGALGTLGRQIRTLQLPSDIGDEAPDDGVEAMALVSHLHFLPGLWTPIHGYDKIADRLRRVCTPNGRPDPAGAGLNPSYFPYDWRLSNRLNGRRLKVVAESALERWRNHAPQNRDAKIVFVCHSMGGLVARWYISKEGGASITRKMITLGTPYRGAVKALSVLADGPMPKLGRFGERLHPIVLSFPSVQQLLPSYACVERSSGEAGYLSDATIPAVAASAIQEAAKFYGQLEEAESIDADTAGRRHAVVGTMQPTTASVHVLNDRYMASEVLAGGNLAGDGTVSLASVPRGTALDSNTLRRIADKHGHLQCNTAALDEVESVVTSDPVHVKGTSTDDLSASVSELFMQDEAVVTSITSHAGRRSVLITLRNENGHTVSEVQKVLRKSAFEYKIAPLEPGAYSLNVRDVFDNSTTGGVHSSFLVWP